MTAPLWLAGVFIIVRDGFLPAEHRNVYIFQYAPLSTHWHWYVIGGLLYLLLLILFIVPAANRGSLEQVNQRHEEKLRRYQARTLRLQTAPQPAPFAGVAAEPNIVARVEVLDVHRDGDGNIVEGSGGRQSRAIVLRCKNEREVKPQRRVGNINNVSAQISISGYGQDTTRFPMEPAAWLSEKSAKVDFPVDATHRLVVLVLDGKDENLQLFAVQRRGASLVKATIESPLKGRLFRVGVSWYADSEKEALASADYMLDLDLYGTGQPWLIGTRLWKDNQLVRFMIEGHKLWRQHIEQGSVTNVDEMSPEQLELHVSVTNWALKVGEFLGTHFDWAAKSRFLGGAKIDIKPDDTPQGRLANAMAAKKDIYKDLDRQIKVLQRLTEED